MNMNEMMDDEESESFANWLKDVIGGFNEGSRFHSAGLRRLIEMTGCEEVPITGKPGKTKMACKLCGPDFNPGKCSKEIHAAYYDAFPRGAS